MSDARGDTSTGVLALVDCQTLEVDAHQALALTSDLGREEPNAYADWNGWFVHELACHIANHERQQLHFSAINRF